MAITVQAQVQGWINLLVSESPAIDFLKTSVDLDEPLIEFFP